jgi:hypothetical protein
MEWDALLLHIERQCGQSAVNHFLEFGWVFAPLLHHGDSLAPPLQEVYRLYKGVEWWEHILPECKTEKEHEFRVEQLITTLAQSAQMEETELVAGLERIKRFKSNWCDE